MAGKRQATSNLNHDNWDQEEEPEERGTFRTATEEELKTRVIKKARRKIVGGSVAPGEDAADEPPAESKSVFSGFSGFGKPAATAAASSPFSFLANLPASTTNTKASSTSEPAKPLCSFLAGSNASDKPVSSSIFGSVSCKAPPSVKESTSTTAGAKPTTSIFDNISVAKKQRSEPKTSLDSSSGKPGSVTLESSQYRESVAELNRAVMKFLQEHMDKSPYCILTPVFKNYEKHLKELQDEESARTNSTKATPPPPLFEVPAAVVPTASSPSKPAVTFSFGKPSTTSAFGKKLNCTVTSGGTTTTSTIPLFSFSSSAASSGLSPTSAKVAAPATSIFRLASKPAGEVKADDAPKPSIFSFGAKDTITKKDEPLAPPPKTNGFSFGLKSKSDDKPSTSLFAEFGKAPDRAGDGIKGFSFTASAPPFSFASIQPPAAAAVTSGEAEDEEDKPPKVEFKQVVEDDAVFSKRCKVFIKKEKDFGDRGVGTLYLKPVKGTEKTQLLVRADTNLGNILVNLILTEGIPCQRMGKNNVMMVCVPTPEDSKATSLLLRVKTGDEADDLLKKIKEHIK